MKARRHSPAEISAKLEQAEALAANGRVQSEIAKTLGVSIMTLHRWRKLDHLAARAPSTVLEVAHGAERRRGRADIVAELQMENRQLRKLVTDLLLEKIKLEEAAGPRAA
jgi:putative transposase